MNPQPHDPEVSLPEGTVQDDLALKRLLRETAGVLPEGLDALNARVLEQWRGQCAVPEAQLQGNAAGTRIASLLGRRPLWIATTGLLAAAAIVAGLWVHQAEPPLEDLLQPDVLSQMAAGEL